MNSQIEWLTDGKIFSLLWNTKEMPAPSQPASSLGGMPTTASTPLKTLPNMILMLGGAIAVTIVLLNILFIGCCLHRRSQKRVKNGK